MSAEPAVLKLELQGKNPPGGTFDGFENVHVGLQRQKAAVHLFRGDAENIAWTLDIETTAVDDNETDFRGPYVHGKRGARFLYLSWGDVGADGTFAMFRRAKVMLNAIEPRLLRLARAGGTLSGSFSLTDARGRGGPLCTTLRPPLIEWTVTVG
ncbi:MAG: DUF5990 family protein [Anaerolineaceae bacterium]